MMSSTTAAARSPVLSPSKKNYRGGHTWQRGPSRAKSGKPYYQPLSGRQNHDDYPKHNVLLHRLSQPSSPSSSTLLERIGGSADNAGDLNLVDGEWEEADNYTDFPFSTVPHVYTPDPGEVERFLASVIGDTGVPPPPPSPPSPPSPVHVCSAIKPTLALETRNLPVDHQVKVEDHSSSVLYSPTQTAVNSLPSADPTFDHCLQSPFLLGDTMPPPSASAIEECRKRLIPVLLASVQARDPGKHLDAEQCRRLLSDDHCKLFLRQAKEMRHQLSSLLSPKTPVNQSRSGSLKRDRVDDVHAWVRNTRNRFDSVSTVVSDVSRRDSDITLVDFPGGRLPPKAPRAMLRHNNHSLNKTVDAALSETPYKTVVASPTTEVPPASALSLIDLVQQAIKMFPALRPRSPLVTEIDTSNISVGTSAGDRSEHPSRAASPIHAISPTSTDFVSQLPTQAGIWFRQQGRRYAEIVDVDIDVGDDMFYLSTDRQPFRLRMHLRLCSVPVSAETKYDNNPAPTWLQDMDGVVNWPKKGKLVVQVNPESERSKTWLPYTLASDPLDVTSCIRPGKNTFRFIQLSDLSEFAFVLAASPPPPEEAWRSWDWASVVARPPRSMAAGDSMNGLSEFAQIPVSIQS